MSLPDITDKERDAVAQVMATNYLSMGPYVQAFEKSFTDFTGAKHAIAVNSGTAGLHLCVRAAGWSDGDRVITTPFSFVSSTNVLLYERITPVFVDAEPLTGNIDPVQLKEAIRDLTDSEAAAAKWLPPKGVDPKGSLKGVLAVDVFGQPADFDSIRECTDPFGMPVIEDACEALGAIYKGRPAACSEIPVFLLFIRTNRSQQPKADWSLPTMTVRHGSSGLFETRDALKAIPGLSILISATTTAWMK